MNVNTKNFSIKNNNNVISSLYYIFNILKKVEKSKDYVFFKLFIEKILK